MAEGSTAEPKPDLSLTGTQLSWMRSDLANLRTLLAWARTSVSMIGFGFTIYNFYRGFLQDLIVSGRQDAARNLGLALVAAGTVAMVVAIWNYWSINQSLVAMEGDAGHPRIVQAALDLLLRPVGGAGPDRVRDTAVHAARLSDDAGRTAARDAPKRDP